MSHTLSELVQSAVRQAAAIPARTKVASAASVAGAQVREALEKRSSAQDPEFSPAMLDNCAYGIKLAEALDISSNLLRQKLASEEPLRTPDDNRFGPAPQTKTKPPTQARATSTITAGDVQTNEEDHTGNVDYSNNKEAALDFIQMKLAQAEVFSQVGDHASAAKALHAAEQEKRAHFGSFDRLRTAIAKVAACEMPTDSSVGGLRMKDNAGMISLTKAEAKRLSQNEAAQYFSANVTKDPILPWASNHSGIAKVSSARRKLARRRG